MEIGLILKFKIREGAVFKGNFNLTDCPLMFK